MATLNTVETMRNDSLPDLVARGQEALTRAAWLEARQLFAQVLEDGESPEALEGLGQACWWLDEVDTVADAREGAYRGYRALGDARGAARLALALAEDALLFRGQEAVSNGWSERARRLLADIEPAPEHAILAVHDAFFAFMLAGDLDEARRRANDAVALAARFDLLDLEMYARAIDGVALVAAGSVVEGMRILDEATAAATSGEMRDAELIASTCCWMIYGCERVRDFSRAAQWCERVKDYSERHGLTSLLGVCRNHYAMVLTIAGAWGDAETELDGAAQQLALRPAQAAEGVARLGELRRRQGRHDEAARFLGDVAFLPEAQAWLALLALDRGDPTEAANLAERLLRQLSPSDRLQRVQAYEVLARARAALGELVDAREALGELESAADQVGTTPLRAAAALAGGAVALASREPNRSRALLEDAVDWYARSRMPYEEAEARLLLAQALTALGEPERAAAEAARAGDAFERLGAEHAHRRARALTPAGLLGKAAGALTPREVEILSLVGDGMSDKAIAEHLTISEHTVHRHVSNILTKLKVSSRAAAVAQATKLDLLWRHAAKMAAISDAAPGGVRATSVEAVRNRRTRTRRSLWQSSTRHSRFCPGSWRSRRRSDATRWEPGAASSTSTRPAGASCARRGRSRRRRTVAGSPSSGWSAPTPRRRLSSKRRTTRSSPPGSVSGSRESTASTSRPGRSRRSRQ